MANTADSSVVISVDLNVDDAEKELSRLKNKIMRLESDLSESKFAKSALEKQLNDIDERIDDIYRNAQRDEMGNLLESDAFWVEELTGKATALAKEIGKINDSIEKGTIALDAAKNRYGEMALEADQLRQQEADRLKQQEEPREDAPDTEDVDIEQGTSRLDQAKGKLQKFISGLKEASIYTGQFAVGALSKVAGIAKNVLSVGGNAIVALGKSAAKAIPKIAGLFARSTLNFAKTFGQGILNAANNLNIFKKISEAAAPTIKRLGGIISGAFIFNAISAGMTTLRNQMASYLGANTQLMNALSQLKGVFLTAFQPIYDVVVPALVTLVNVLTQVVAAIGQFIAALFGKTAKQAQKNAGALNQQAGATKAAGDAAEEAAGSLAAFDEINTIQTENKAGGGGGGGGAGGVGLGEAVFDYDFDDTVFDSWGEAFSAFLDKILNEGIPRLKKAFSAFADWLNDFSRKLLDMFTFPGVKEKVELIGQELANAFNDLVNAIDWNTLGQALGAGLNLALLLLTNFIYTFDWVNLGNKLADFINGAVSQIDWYAVGQLLWSGYKIAIETLAGLLMGLDYKLLGEAASNLALGFLESMDDTFQRISELGTTVANGLNQMVSVIRWDEIGSALGSGLNGALQILVDFIYTFDWYTLGNEIATFLNEAINQIDWNALGQLLWTKFKIIIETLAGFLSTVNTADLASAASDLVTGFFDAMTDTIQRIDWQQIGRQIGAFLIDIDWIGVLNSVWNAISSAFGALVDLIFGIGVSVIEGLLEGILDGVSGIGTWIKENVVDPFINGFKKLFGINSPSTVMKELGGYIMEGLLDGIKSFLQPILTFFQELWNNIKTAAVNAWNGIKSALSDVWNSLKTTVTSTWTNIKTTISDAWTNIKNTGSSVWSNIKSSLTSVWNGLKSTVSTVWSSIKTVISNAWNSVKSTSTTIWNGIKTSVLKVVNTIKSGITTAFNSVKSFVSTCFNSVKKTITNAFSSIWTNIRKTINSIISGVEKMANGAIKGVNGVIKALNGLKFTIPSWIPGYGGKSVGFNIKTLGTISIPRLAQGAVIPPNREFMAVLGDQTSGTNVEAPLDTIKQALIEALREVGGLGGGDINITLEVDGAVVARKTVKHINDMTRQAGKSVLLY